MSSPKPKKKGKAKKNDKSLTNPARFQTLTSMFAKQKQQIKIKQIESDDDDDDFIQITKIETKSKFFKRKSTELKSPNSKEEKGLQTSKNNTKQGEEPSLKKRRLSLRKLSSRLGSKSSCSGSSSDTSVIVLSDSPVKDQKICSNTSNVKIENLSCENVIKNNQVGQCNGTLSKKNSLQTLSDSNVEKLKISETESPRKAENEQRGKKSKSIDKSIPSNSESSNSSTVDKSVINESQICNSNRDLRNGKLVEKLASGSKTIAPSDNEEISNNENKSQKIKEKNIKAKKESMQVLDENSNSQDMEDDSQSLEDSRDLEEGEEEGGEDGEEYRIPYYLQNFTTILNSVMEDESNVKLFNKSDLKIIDTFRNLSENGQKLYIRLFSRKLQWLNCEKVKYPKIAEDLTDVIQELVDAHLLSTENELSDLEVVLKILPAPELKSLAKTYHVNTMGLQKPQIIEVLYNKTKQATITSMFGAKGGLTKAMLQKAKKHAGRCIRLQEEERRVFVRILMLFSVVSSSLDEDSANGGQNQMFQMLMVNMGKVVYPQYTINKQTNIFPDRQYVILYEKALQYEADLINFVERSKWEDAYQLYLKVRQEYDSLPKKHKNFEGKLPDFLRRYTTGHVLTKILSQGIEILQRRKDYHGAIDLIEWLLKQEIYCLDYHGYWWERLALNYDVHLKKPLQALTVVKKGMGDENVREGHRLALFQRAEKICQTASLKIKHKLTEFVHDEVRDAPKTTVEGRIIPYSVPGIKHKFMTQNSYYNGEELEEQVTMCNVEQVVLDYYKQDYPDGLHAEGAIISSLFSLFFWDILFMDVPDAFHSLYQTNPLDKMSLEFYRRRKEQIDDRLKWLENSSIEELNERSKETWEKNCDKVCAGINWERLQSIEYIQGLISCIGGRLLSGILARYAKDPRHTRSGFPDLTIWNIHNKTFKIVEVKGPGDRLSHKQILWLSYLLKLGVDAEVCHVKAVGAKKLKAGT